MELELNITETVIPEATRAEKPNPFASHFPTKEGKAIELDLPYGTEEEKKHVLSITTLAQKAGRACNTTTRVRKDEFREGRKQYIKLTMWSVDPIKRPRNGETAVVGETPDK